ncbi:MAG: beta-Ala-His dipeptidase, partial [Paeniclostridium sp.]
MELIKNLKSEKVFYFFKQISMIPRNSGNEKNISNYLLKFAKDRNLDVVQDNSFNIIIKKDATKGYEDFPPVIIQGHMDMVCVKSNDSNHDFKIDPLELKLVDNKYLYANNTTLGGDNGIAIAYGLAILDSDDIKHPKLEFVFTTEEETTMNGAQNLDTNLLEGKILLNIDSEEEGVFTLGCAGGILMDSELLLEFEEIKSPTYKIEIGGLLGGHSGIQADRKRANANKLMARLLFEFKKEMDINIISIDGGDKYNSIPNVCCSI